MTPSPVFHDSSQLSAAGYVSTGETLSDMPGIGLLRMRAIQQDVTMESITAFRTAPGKWEIFLKPGAQSGFVDQPLLNF